MAYSVCCSAVACCSLLSSRRICKRQEPMPIHKLPRCLEREGGQPRAL